MTLVDGIAATAPGRVALIEGDRQVTYGELYGLVVRTANGLLEGGHVHAGDLVCVAAPTGVDCVVAYLGVQAAGCAAAMLDPRAPVAERASRLELLESPFVVTTAGIELPDGVRAARPAGSTNSNDLPVLDGAGGAPPSVDADAPAAVLFTTGVAGAPRPAVLTHANLAAVQHGLIEQPSSRLDSSTVALGVLPLSHIFGLNSTLGTILCAGGTVVLVDRFDPDASLALIGRHQITAIAAVPRMWDAWAALDEAPGDALATVVRATASATHLPVEVVDAVRARFGITVAGGYGLTETSGTIALDDPAAPNPLTVGWPLGDVEIRFVDSEGDDAELGDPAEIWVRGPSVFAGYAATGGRASLEPGGWYRTGDVGLTEADGRLRIVDRIKDVIIVSGFNVAPIEVEGVLLRHPAVEAAMVSGEADPRSGERVVAYVVAAEAAVFDADAVIDFCRGELARYKVPVRIEVREELPTSDVGKAIRRLLQ